MGWRLTVKRKNTTETHHRRKKTGKKRGGTGPNDAPAAPAASTVAPTGTIPEPRHTSVAVIKQTTYDPITKSTICIFDNGVQITADQDKHPQQYRCTISSQT